MNKVGYWLGLLLFLSIIMACTTDREDTGTVGIGYELEVNILNLAVEPAFSYRVFLNNRELSIVTSNKMASQDRSGRLQVYKVDSSKSGKWTVENKTAEIDQNITIASDNTITLIEYQGEIDLFDCSKYIRAAIGLIFESEEDTGQFEVLFNDIPVRLSTYMYLKTEELTGKLKIWDTKSKMTIFEKQVQLIPEDALVLFQLEASEFIELDNTEDPAKSNRYCKVRFFYLGKDGDLLQEDSYRFVVYQNVDQANSDSAVVVGEAVVKKGELSPYFEIDLEVNKQLPIGLDIYNNMGELVYNHLEEFFGYQLASGSTSKKAANKFETFRLCAFYTLNVVSVPW